MRQFATFWLGDQLFGMDVLLVREINQQVEFTEVPGSAEFVRGLTNLRGRIITCLDLGVRLGLPPREVGRHSHNLILKTEDELEALRARYGRDDLETGEDPTGLLVDAPGEVVTVGEESIEPPPPSISEICGHFLEGVVKLDGQLLALLDVRCALGLESAPSLDTQTALSES